MNILYFTVNPFGGITGAGLGGRGGVQRGLRVAFGSGVPVHVCIVQNVP